MALVPSAAFLAAYESVLLPSIKCMQGWRPVRPELIHVTLTFMADAGPAMIEAAVAAVHAVAAVGSRATEARATGDRAPVSYEWAVPIGLRFGPPRPFPTASRPRVLAIAPVQGAAALAGLWDGFNGLFSREALARELPTPDPQWRPGGGFSPHLSLARPVTRPASRLGSLPESMAALDEDFIFDELVLYESILGPQGPHYSPLAQASLTGGA